jgi:hypothetical protein
MSNHPVPVAFYNAVIMNFFATILNEYRSAAPIGYDDTKNISLKRLEEQRTRTPFPEAFGESDYRKSQAIEVNRLVRILNRTEDKRVFWIAVNAILLIVFGKIGYQPEFEGSEYAPDQLQAAMEAVEEHELMA